LRWVPVPVGPLAYTSPVGLLKLIVGSPNVWIGSAHVGTENPIGDPASAFAAEVERPAPPAITPANAKAGSAIAPVTHRRLDRALSRIGRPARYARDSRWATVKPSHRPVGSSARS